mgnify:FL=1|jgi:hypothetical protein
MYALVIDNKITKQFFNLEGFTIGDLQYPADIFTKWSVEEKEAIGIYEVVFDKSNFKNENFYINTVPTFTFANDTVTASYGTATSKNSTELKTQFIKDLKITVANILAETDWYITRNTEKSTAIPSAISTHRNLVRSRQAAMETAITNASDTPALETLYTYTTTDGVTSRPIGELPILEI